LIDALDAAGRALELGDALPETQLALAAGTSMNALLDEIELDQHPPASTDDLRARLIDIRDRHRRAGEILDALPEGALDMPGGIDVRQIIRQSETSIEARLDSLGG
jgi:hypothetical protein